MKILGPVNYRLKWQDTDNTDTVHVGNLKPGNQNKENRNNHRTGYLTTYHCRKVTLVVIRCQ